MMVHWVLLVKEMNYFRLPNMLPQKRIFSASKYRADPYLCIPTSFPSILNDLGTRKKEFFLSKGSDENFIHRMEEGYGEACKEESLSLKIVESILQKMNLSFHLSHSASVFRSIPHPLELDLSFFRESNSMKITIDGTTSNEDLIVNQKVDRSTKEDFVSLLEDYQKNLAETSSLNKKFIAIVFFAQDCNRLHPLENGNKRFSMLLLNRELWRNGFAPCIPQFKEHQVSILFSGQQILDMVVQGQENFLAGASKAVCTRVLADLVEARPRKSNIPHFLAAESVF